MPTFSEILELDDRESCLNESSVITEQQQETIQMNEYRLYWKKIMEEEKKLDSIRLESRIMQNEIKQREREEYQAKYKEEEKKFNQEKRREYEKNKNQYQQYQPNTSTIDGRRQMLLNDLELPATATVDDIKQQYRKQMMKYHPDKVATKDEATQREYTEKAKQINESYTKLIKQKFI